MLDFGMRRHKQKFGHIDLRYSPFVELNDVRWTNQLHVLSFANTGANSTLVTKNGRNDSTASTLHSKSFQAEPLGRKTNGPSHPAERVGLVLGCLRLGGRPRTPESIGWFTRTAEKSSVSANCPSRRIRPDAGLFAKSRGARNLSHSPDATLAKGRAISSSEGKAPRWAST